VQFVLFFHYLHGTSHGRSRLRDTAQEGLRISELVRCDNKGCYPDRQESADHDRVRVPNQLERCLNGKRIDAERKDEPEPLPLRFAQLQFRLRTVPEGRSRKHEPLSQRRNQPNDTECNDSSRSSLCAEVA